MRRRARAAAGRDPRGQRELKLSNLDKLFWPEEGITKGDLIAYYRDVAPVLVPHLRDRPFTMKRYPDGWQGKHFFQKDAPSHMPDWIATRAVPRVDARRREADVDYPLVNDDLALLWMANMGCIDLNTWYSRVDKPERPDWVLFDLDPSDGRRLRGGDRGRAARQATCSTRSGSRASRRRAARDGIHVLVPIERRHTYDGGARVRRDRRRRARPRPPGSRRRPSGRRRSAAAS